MKASMQAAAAVILAAGMIVPLTMGQDAPQRKVQVVQKTKAAPAPTVEEQIQALKQELEGQIQALKQELAEKDAALRQALEATKSAQASKEAVAAEQQKQAEANAAAVNSLQSAVNDLKGNQASLAATVSGETAKLKKSLDKPTTLHYKGVTISPGGYLAADTIYRSHATGADISTPFSSLPYESADSYSLSEFYGGGRSSRISLLVEGKTKWGLLRGYYEGDFLSAGVTSNSNVTDSYNLRQRMLYAQAQTNSGWTFVGGQMWSLATETKKGISNLAGDVATPQVVDGSLEAGFVYARQYGFRVVKSFPKYAVGVSAENPQLLYTATLAGNTPYAVLGSAGNSSGGYNGGVSTCSPSTAIVNYTNGTDTAGNSVAVPVYKTLTSCTNLSNISFNTVPDVIVKAAADPGYGHYEVFAIGRTAQETVYPGETTNSNLYGGLTDIVSGATVAPALSVAGAFKNRIYLGGFGGGFRVPATKYASVGVKGLYGAGVGRYSSTNLSDVTVNTWGGFSPLHNASGLATVEITPQPRWVIFAMYGGDYASRNAWSGSTLAAPTASKNTAGTKWGGTWKAPASKAVGYGSPLLDNSACLTPANPGYTGSSTGYYPGSGCGAQNRNVQEFTMGYWYDIYKGDAGRLRQVLQYSYVVREGWSGAAVVTGGPGVGAKGIENMIFTGFRYYLP